MKPGASRFRATAVLVGLPVASHAVLAQDATVGDQQTQPQKQSDYWNGLNANYHNDDSANYPFTV